MPKKLIIFFFSIFITLHHGFAQKTKQFDDDIEKYPEVVAEMFSTNLPADDKALISQFNSDWAGGIFTGNEKIDIVRISNAFLVKKARNIHYWMLWRCMQSFKKPENSAKGYDAWIKAVDAACLDRRTTPTSLQTLMIATLDLLNKRLICSSAGSDWKCSNDDYRFDFTNNRLSVIVGSCDLYCFSKGDSIMIGQTTGRFLMNEQQWKGKGGAVTWERAGFAPGDVSARLDDYTINMKQSQYEADSVLLTHTAYFPTPVMGKLVDKVRRNSSPETAIYPEFITYNKKFIFENLYADITYEGGISIQGARIIGAGTDEEKATIQIQKGDSLRIDIKSKSYIFRKDRVNARNVSLNIHLNGDSIYHNNLSFVYLVEAKEVSFIRSDAASSKAPYNDSYHEVDMDFEQLIWKTDEPLMSFSMTRGAAGGRAQFRSQNYFDQRYFESLQYFDAVHPLVSIRQCVANWGSETFPSEAYASHIRRSVTDARAQLIEIAKLGFILFDGDKDEATVQPRLYEFLAAAAKKTDFDVIDLRSSITAPTKNALFNVKNHDLIINGIEKFMVSDSQQVVIKPRNQQVVMKKNRAIEIDGRIDAGQIELYGDSLHFDYDTFKINLYRVDSLYMYVPTSEKDALGRPRQRRLKTAIEKLSGNILIDLPDNKSGRQSLQQYPVLNSDSASYVFYGSADIAGGAYKTESFYFELDPFVIDSIDNFSKESLALSGKFVSADIFSDMRQTLRVQPDYSLGFIYESGDSAISAYNNARLHAEVRLSNRGLEASGQLDYLTASIHTDDFRIYPDSMNVPVAKEFTLRKQTEGTEFPEVKAEGNSIHWEPKKEKMYIYKKDKNFNIYNPETYLDGSLLLTPEGLSGKGRVDMGTADIRSDSIAFKSNTFSSDTSVFRLKAQKDGPYMLVTVDSLRSEIDFNTRKGRFIPGKDYALVEFPSNKFAAHIDGMIWDMDSAKVYIGSVDTVTRPVKEAVDFKYHYPGEGKGARYYSTAKDADSLNFVASRAMLDITLGNLKAEGVNLVKTSDAIVYPSDGRLTLTPEGSLELIRNARVVFNDSLMQHTVYNADIKIGGRHQYIGFGKYDYVDETGKTFVIDIPRIGTDNSGKTIANGAIPVESDFMLSPYFRYQGNMTLSSDDQFPVFEGTTQIVQECETLRPQWFKFKSPVNPNSIHLIVDEAPVNINNSKIFNGLFLTSDSSHIYPAFFSLRKNYSDNQLIVASGVLSYDKDSMIYFIAPESKLKNRDTIGNLIAFNRDRCLLSGEGRLSLGTDLGRVKTDVVGRITHNLNNQETSLDVMMSFDFHFDHGLAALMAGKIDSFPMLTGVDMQHPRFIRGMNEWLGVRKTETFRRDALMGKVKNFPAELNKTLVLTQLNLQWNQENRSYRSVGKIGVGNIFGHQVNRLVDGLVEITKRPTGDYADIYLKLDDRNWYYFGYTRELMQVISSDQTFNDRLVKLPEKQRKTDDKRPGFTFMIASSDKLDQFLKQFQQRNAPADQLPQAPTVIQDAGRPATQPLPGTPPVKKDEEDAPIIEVE
jgi:hypothetical protein